MKMESTTAAASILLFLLASLVAADDGDTIRLPSNGTETQGVGAVAWPAIRPWDCCDAVEINPAPTNPPWYICHDMVKQCSPFCHDCQQVVPGAFPWGRYVCNDWFQTNDPGPLCSAGRPWDCCDNVEMNPAPTNPPWYLCHDVVKHCSPFCHDCQQVVPGPFPWGRYVCNDWYQTNDPGPLCTAGRPWDCCDNAVVSDIQFVPPLYRCEDEVKQCSPFCHDCQVVVPGPFPRGSFVCNDWYNTDDPGPVCTERPWGACCDNAICDRKRIPTCHCADEVESCFHACNQCEAVESWPWRPLFVCQDRFTGLPGPRCTP